MTRIAVLGRFGGMADEIPRQLPDEEVTVLHDGDDVSRATAVECAIGTNNGQRVGELLRAAPKLRWYHSIGAGIEGLVGVRELRDGRVTLTNNSGSYDVQIAEHVIALVLASSKRLHLYRDQQSRGEWKERSHAELRDATMVVYGIGSIGAEAGRLAAGFGMKVIGVRRRAAAIPGVSRVVPPEQLADAAAEADYLVIAAPLTAATKGAVSREVIGRMKKNAWIINVARGAIVDEGALLDALRDGRLGGAGLDAFTVEPLPKEHPLWSLENVIITPHSSNSSPRLRERTFALFAENLRRFKSGEALLNVVDLESGY